MMQFVFARSDIESLNGPSAEPFGMMLTDEFRQTLGLADNVDCTTGTKAHRKAAGESVFQPQ